MGLQRSIEPEWLDWLPAEDPRAIESRRDLRRLNLLMGHAGILKRILFKSWRYKKPASILELGAGDGTLMLAVARRVTPRWRDVCVTLVDRQPFLSEESRRNFASLGWRAESVTSDVFGFLNDTKASRFDFILANLFLHHFEEQDLARLFDIIARRGLLFAACEPRRNWRALIASRGLWALGCNDVTRHDAPVSARAGFNGKELSRLWPNLPGWTLQERAAGFFSHCFVASHEV